MSRLVYIGTHICQYTYMQFLPIYTTARHHFEKLLTYMEYNIGPCHLQIFMHCHAAAAVAEMLTVCFVNIEFRERKKLILNQVLISSNSISPVPKLPESTRRKQAIFNKSHCSIVTTHSASTYTKLLCQINIYSIIKYYLLQWAMSPTWPVNFPTTAVKFCVFKRQICR
jgi:hypothetical protein